MDKIIQLTLYLLAYFLLLFGYYSFVFPIYGYSGFRWDPDNIKLLESIVMLVLIALILPVKFKKPSDILLHVHFFMPILPMLVLYYSENWYRMYMYSVFILFILVIFFVKYVRLPTIRIFYFSPKIMLYTILVVVLFYITSIFVFGGVRYFNLNLSKVYEYRSAAAAILPNIYGYFSPMMTKVLLPLLLVLAIVEKKYIHALIAMVLSILMFGLTNHKGPLFYPVIVLSIYFFLKREKTIILMIYGYMFIFATSIIGFMYGGLGNWVGSLLMRRAFFVPAQLNFFYYDFFSVHPHTLLARSKLTVGLIDYPYDLSLPYLIGLNYFSSPTVVGANTGWLGSGYAHFGILGMFLYAVIIAIFLSMINSYSGRLTKEIVVAILIVPILSLYMSSDLPTAFLTHGVLIILFLCASFVVNQLPSNEGG